MPTMKRLLASLTVSVLTLGIISAASPAHAASPGVSGLLAFQSNRSGKFQVLSSNPDGTQPLTLAQITNGNAYDAAWSPDGKKIAFSSCCTAGNFEIYTINADGTGLTRLTTLGRNTVPSWSPAGGRITFQTNRDGNFEIYTMSASGADQVDVSNNPGVDQNPAWSPDGSQIAFESSRSGKFQIYTMTDTGQSVVNLSNNTFNDTEPNWSPGGSLLAFQSDRTGNADIFSMNAVDGSNQVDLSNNSAADSRPAWSPDGAKVAFDSNRTGNSEIFTMDANGANQIDVTNSSATDQRPDWQPLAPGQKVMTVSDSGFSAAMVTVKRGDRLEWDFAGAASHTATDSSGMNLFGSGSMPAGGTYGFGFCAAATYGVVDALNTSNTATVQVPISVQPSAGHLGDVFTITWSCRPAASGYAFDVQIKRPGSGHFEPWMSNQTVVSATFTPDAGIGVYKFRSLMKNLNTGATTGFSKPESTTIT